MKKDKTLRDENDDLKFTPSSFLSLARKEYGCITNYCNAYNQLSHVGVNNPGTNNTNVDANTAMCSFYDASKKLRKVHAQVESNLEIAQKINLKRNHLQAISDHVQLSRRCIATCFDCTVLDELGFPPAPSHSEQNTEDYQLQIVTLAVYNAALSKLRQKCEIEENSREQM